MSLIDLKTNLKSLKFGNDKFGYGSSNQPYIQTPIPDGDLPVNYSDFLLRQGAVSDSIIDLKRIGKWFASADGIQFVAKQELLSRIAVKTQASTGILNDGIYSPLNTLAEVGVVATGVHLYKQGLNPADVNTYEEQQSEDIKKEEVNYNRLVGLYKKKIGGDPSISGFLEHNSIAPDDVNIIQYNGGPGSDLGIGNTNIRFATDNVGAPLRTNKKQKETWGSEDIEKAEPIQFNPISINNDGITDFRTILKNQIKSLPYSGSEAKNIETRINLGDPGAKNNGNVVSYVNGVTTDISSSAYGAASEFSYDKINALPLYKSNVVNGGANASITNDLVQFRIAAIDGVDPNQKIFMHFRAFLTSISDAYSADWNSIQYIGRGEKFYTYEGFDRKVSFGFTVAAQSKAELMPMYRKLNFLASNLAPDYTGNGYMKGPLMQLSIGGYFYEQPGFITSLNYDISEESTWEIGVSDKQNSSQIIKWSDSTVKELPHMIKVTINFTPIHTFRPEKVDFGDNINKMPLNDRPVNTDETIGNYPLTRFIALANGKGEGDSNYQHIESGTPSNKETPKTLPTIHISAQPNIYIGEPNSNLQSTA
jgi:hypothetical protein